MRRRFFKNLNPDQLSTSSSNITLHNLELNEDTLASLFLLSPSSVSKDQSMIKVTSALCSSVSISIPWTSITTSSIVITFDSLDITIDILETPTGSPIHQVSPLASLASSNEEEKSYGFVDKIIDGICFSLNTLHIELRSSKFTATLDLSFLRANPSPPNFKTIPGTKQDLRCSRIKCSPYVLLFKKISWQTLKLEAKAVLPDDESSNSMSSVIRLISSGGYTDLTVKKSLLNREVVCAKCTLVLDDVLWLMSATSSQSRSAMALSEFISSFIVSQSASTVNKSSGDNKTTDEVKGLNKTSPVKASQLKMDTNSPLYNLFIEFDPIESSVEFNLRTFQLQFIDDMSIGKINEPIFHSHFPPLKSGSAFLIAATAISITIYPEYNPARLANQVYQLRNSKLFGSSKGAKKTSKKKFIDTSTFSRQEDALNILITVQTLELHCVGLNDTRLKKNKSNDFEVRNKCIFQAPASTTALPDDVPAVEICYNHYYENEPKKRKDINYRAPLIAKSDTVQVKVGPSRLYFDPPTLLWLHSFIVPLTTVHLKPTFAIASQESSGHNVTSPEDPFTEISIQLIYPVVVVDEKNPFDLFPSPFLPEDIRQKLTSVTREDKQFPDEIEITAAQLNLHRLNTTEADEKWTIEGGPIWVNHIHFSGLKDPLDTKRMLETRSEIVETFSIRGSVMMFDETQVSMEEIRINLDIIEKDASSLSARINCDQIATVLRVINKLDTFSDFIAQDKLLMKQFYPTMPDSLLTMTIKVPDLQVTLVKPKNNSDASDATQVDLSSNVNKVKSSDAVSSHVLSEISDCIPIEHRASSASSSGSMHKSLSVPEDVLNVSGVALETPSSSLTLNPHQLEGQRRSGSNCSLRSEIELSGDTRYEDDDQYILNVMNVPASMSSSPSLQSISVDNASLNSYNLIDDASINDDIEEAEEVTALIDESYKCTSNQKIYEEIINIFLGDISVEKRSNGLHGVTEIISCRPISLFTPFQDEDANNSCKRGTGRDNFIFLMRSEIKWTHEDGKKELTSIIFQNQPQLTIDNSLLANISSNFVVPDDAAPPSSPPMSIILRNINIKMVDENDHNSKPLSVSIDIMNVQRTSENCLRILPLDSERLPLSYIYSNHAELFSVNPAVSGLPDSLISLDAAPIDEAQQSLQEEIKKNAQLQKQIDELQKELDLLRSHSHS